MPGDKWAMAAAFFAAQDLHDTRNLDASFGTAISGTATHSVHVRSTLTASAADRIHRPIRLDKIGRIDLVPGLLGSHAINHGITD